MILGIVLGGGTYQNHISQLIGQPYGENVGCIIHNKVFIKSQDGYICND